MPIQIDEFQTEVELMPSTGGQQAAPPAQRPAAQVMEAKLDARGILACLEAELDSYLRQRG
jgi:hypothetical protein